MIMRRSTTLRSRFLMEAFRLLKFLPEANHGFRSSPRGHGLKKWVKKKVTHFRTFSLCTDGEGLKLTS